MESGVYGRLAALAAAAFLTFTILDGGAARAQCTGSGVAIGSCTNNAGFEGCCSDPSTVSWCEGGYQCEIDCGSNQAGSCCEANPGTIGCCDSAITQCVCDLDPYCCGDDAFFGGGEWDENCAQSAIYDCGDTCTSCGGPANSCGWRADDGYYDCMDHSSSDPTGQFPATCGGSSCTPQCSGKSCGSNGCGGSCGSCGPNQP